MNIPLDKGYRLSSDSRQWMIQELGRVKNKDTGEWEEKWTSINFHPTPEMAIKHHAQMRVRQQEAESLAQALEKIENVMTELTMALSNDFEIIRRK